jgi:hypothetical protein
MPPQPHPALSGVWAKIDRAVAHRAALQQGVQHYLDGSPYRVAGSVNAGVVTLRAEPTVAPPIELALILGDLVQCLRSALDHMAWAFAMTTRPDDPSPRTQFPIMANRPKDFDSEAQVRDLPPSVRYIMEQLQPYQPEHYTGGHIGRELASLRRLSNLDKHRVLLVAERVVAIQFVAHNTPEGTESGIHFRQDPDGRWAEIDHPADPRYGPYDARFQAQVTLVEPDLPWRTGLDGMADNLIRETRVVVAAFRGEWHLFEA